MNWGSVLVFSRSSKGWKSGGNMARKKKTTPKETELDWSKFVGLDDILLKLDRTPIKPNTKLDEAIQRSVNFHVEILIIQIEECKNTIRLIKQMSNNNLFLNNIKLQEAYFDFQKFLRNVFKKLTTYSQ